MKKENFEKAMNAVKALAQCQDKMSGLSSYGDGKKSYHFAWVDMAELARAKNIEDALRAWRWSVFFDENGDITGIQFEGEKLGDDKVLFDAIAPFVGNGSFIEMSGEDSAMWRWVFKNGEMVEKWPEIKWE